MSLSVTHVKQCCGAILGDKLLSSFLQATKVKVTKRGRVINFKINAPRWINLGVLVSFLVYFDVFIYLYHFGFRFRI